MCTCHPLLVHEGPQCVQQLLGAERPVSGRGVAVAGQVNADAAEMRRKIWYLTNMIILG